MRPGHADHTLCRDDRLLSSIVFLITMTLIHLLLWCFPIRSLWLLNEKPDTSSYTYTKRNCKKKKNSRTRDKKLPSFVAPTGNFANHLFCLTVLCRLPGLTVFIRSLINISAFLFSNQRCENPILFNLWVALTWKSSPLIIIFKIIIRFIEMIFTNYLSGGRNFFIWPLSFFFPLVNYCIKSAFVGPFMLS